MDESSERGSVFDVGLIVADGHGRDAIRAQERDRMPAEEAVRAEDQYASQPSLRPKTTSHGMKSANKAAVRTRLPSSLPAAAASASPKPSSQTVHDHCASQRGRSGVLAVSIAPATLYRPLATIPLTRSGPPTSNVRSPVHAISTDSAVTSATTPSAATATARRAIAGQPSRDPHHQKKASSESAAAIQSAQPVRHARRWSATYAAPTGVGANETPGASTVASASAAVPLTTAQIQATRGFTTRSVTASSTERQPSWT